MNKYNSSIKWTPTKERLPEKRGSYLITILLTDCSYLDVVDAEFFPPCNYSWGERPARWGDPSGEFYYTLDEVIAWAYKPEPYKEDK